MEWLNTSVTFLNSAEFRRSKIEQRGIWLTLMSYCVQQENGGRIEGTTNWTEWDWQQVLGVSEKTVHEDCTLWGWEDGAVLVLHGYPLNKQREVQKNRRSGRKGGKSTSEAKTNAARLNGSKHKPSTTEAETNQEPSNHPTERKGNRKGRGIGKERKGNRPGADAPSGPPSLESWLEHAHIQHPDWPEIEARAAWSHYEAAGWMLSRGKPVRSWQACIETCFARWQGAGKKSSVTGDARSTDNPNAGLQIFNEPVAPVVEAAR